MTEKQVAGDCSAFQSAQIIVEAKAWKLISRLTQTLFQSESAEVEIPSNDRIKSTSELAR